MNQYAIPGIMDTSITPTIQVVEKVKEWVEALRNGRDHNGDDLKTVETINGKLDRMMELQKSPLYVATQITVCKRLLKCLERKCKRNELRRKDILDRKQKRSLQENSRSSKEDTDGEDSEDETEILDPVLFNVLKSVEHKMDKTLEEIKGKYDESEIQLSKLVRL